MEQCKICNNKEQCEKWHWVVTMDKGYKIDKPFEEFMCDNFITNETIQFHKVKGDTNMSKARKIARIIEKNKNKGINIFEDVSVEEYQAICEEFRKKEWEEGKR